MTLEEKITNIKGRKYGGSSTKDGKLYHALPFEEFANFRRHRGGTIERINNIARLTGVEGKSVLDLGCSVGGISFGMIQKGAKSVLGIDYDTESIEVANEVKAMKGYSNIEFRNQDITIELIKGLPTFDVIICLSQWMWIVKQKGMEYAKDLLFEISKKADMMIFESAANDGMARIKGATQEDVEKWLHECTCYERIKRHPSTKGWMNRSIFVCSRPWFYIESTRRAASSIVERISRDKIKKMYRKVPKDCRWMQEREVKALKLLEKYDSFPKVLEEGEGYIVMNYIGRRIKFGFVRYREQAMKILEEIREVGIIHRDINRKNFLLLNGKLYLIDFGWCVFKDEDITKARTHRNLPTGTDEELFNRYFNK